MVSASRILPLFIAVCFTIGLPTRLRAVGEPLGLGVLLGPCLPSSSVANVYKALDTLRGLRSYLRPSNEGFHIGGRVRFGLSESVSFSGGMGFYRFPGQSQIVILDSGQGYMLQTATTFVPITAGVTMFAFRGLISPYATVEGTYTYRHVSVTSGNTTLEDIIVSAAQTELEPSTARIGAAIAVGLQADIGGLKPFAEVRYNLTNLIGAGRGESQISFVTVSLGLFL